MSTTCALLAVCARVWAAETGTGTGTGRRVHRCLCPARVSCEDAARGPLSARGVCRASRRRACVDVPQEDAPVHSGVAAPRSPTLRTAQRPQTTRRADTPPKHARTSGRFSAECATPEGRQTGGVRRGNGRRCGCWSGAEPWRSVALRSEEGAWGRTFDGWLAGVRRGERAWSGAPARGRRSVVGAVKRRVQRASPGRRADVRHGRPQLCGTHTSDLPAPTRPPQELGSVYAPGTDESPPARSTSPSRPGHSVTRRVAARALLSLGRPSLCTAVPSGTTAHASMRPHLPCSMHVSLWRP